MSEWCLLPNCECQIYHHYAQFMPRCSASLNWPEQTQARPVISFSDGRGDFKRTSWEGTDSVRAAGPSHEDSSQSDTLRQPGSLQPDQQTSK